MEAIIIVAARFSSTIAHDVANKYDESHRKKEKGGRRAAERHCCSEMLLKRSNGHIMMLMRLASALQARRPKPE